MRAELMRAMTFCAAHRVATSPHESARRLHGHSFGVELRLEGPLDEQRGWLMDFGAIREAFAPCAEQLNHSYLNEIEGLETPDNPSLACWIFDRLKPGLPALERVHVTILGELRFAPRRLLEDARLRLPERVGFSLESAHRLPFAGEGHKCQRLHGHSFRVEVGAGDVARLAEPLRHIYDLLDHHYLNEIEGLENPTSENLAAWIWQTLRADVPDLSVVVVRESPECACVYRGQRAD